MGRGLLEGVRVLDLGRYVAAPLTATLLADFGAEVIKVEVPRLGEPDRHIASSVKNGESVRWKVTARNKKSVTLDLRLPKGQELLRKLARTADALVENFQPGTLETWHIGWEDLHRVNPKLIMLRISGYGQTGPYRNRPAFGRAGEAMSGVLQITGYEESSPIPVGFPLADTTTGLGGAWALSMALYHRDVLGDGEGQYIDLALYETLFRLIDWQVVNFDQFGMVAKRKGTRMAMDAVAVSSVYQTADDQWVIISWTNRNALTGGLRAIGGDQLAKDPRFDTVPHAYRNFDQLDPIVAEWMRARPAAEITRLFVEHNSVAALIYSAKEMMEDEQILSREDIVAVEDDKLGPMRMVGVVPKFSATPGAVRWTGPALGQHNEEIYGGLLGLPATELRDLQEEGVI